MLADVPSVRGLESEMDADEDHVSGEWLFYMDCLGTPAKSPVAPVDPRNKATDNGEPGCPARTAHKPVTRGRKVKIGRARSSPKLGRPYSLTPDTDGTDKSRHNFRHILRIKQGNLGQ
jgi:hypothetical protein